MSAFEFVYRDAARSFWFDGTRRFAHKVAGVVRITANGAPLEDRWIGAAEGAIWPLVYRWHYLRERAGNPGPPPIMTVREREDTQFGAALSRANRGSDVLEPDWTIQSCMGEEFRCERNGLTLRVSRGQIEAPACKLEVGQTVAIRFPSERRYWIPGYYCTLGGRAEKPDFRLYFNVKPASAAWLLETVTEAMEHAGAGYQFKILNHPAGYTRPDAAVLYPSRDALEPCREIARRVAAGDPQALRAPTPLLARRIHAGIAVADEPPFSERRMSFGEHRSRIVARGIARACAGGPAPLDRRIEYIYREFEREGLNADRPYSGAGPSATASDF